MSMQKLNMTPATQAKNVTKLQVTIAIESKKPLFQVDGAFPSFISSINYGKLYNHEPILQRHLLKKALANNVFSYLIDDSRINDVDIKEGDCIMAINGQNVSRASAKSVKKILRSVELACLTIHRPSSSKAMSRSLHSKNNTSTDNRVSKFFKKFYKSHMSCIKPHLSTTAIPVQQSSQSVIDSCQKSVDEVSLDDVGYHSMPTNSLASSKHSSTSSLATAESGFSSYDEGSTNSISSFKASLEQFIGDLQHGIQAYVRPTTALNILNERENFMLYQNVEKLVPVAKFLLNVISQLENDSVISPESITIILNAFKTYVSGLPAAVEFLGKLTNVNESFVLFMEKLGGNMSLPIFDFIFMPFNFVCQLVEFFEEMENKDEKVVSIVKVLYNATMEAHSNMEQKFSCL